MNFPDKAKSSDWVSWALIIIGFTLAALMLFAQFGCMTPEVIKQAAIDNEAAWFAVESKTPDNAAIIPDIRAGKENARAIVRYTGQPENPEPYDAIKAEQRGKDAQTDESLLWILLISLLAERGGKLVTKRSLLGIPDIIGKVIGVFKK